MTRRKLTSLAVAAETSRKVVDEVLFLTPADVSKRYNSRVKIGTLRNWRSLRRGPPFTYIGGRVMYPLSELIAWEKVNTTYCRSL